MALTTYFNKEYSQLFKKNDCPENLGSDELFVVPVAQFVSEISQEDADGKAIAYAGEYGQDYANRVGGCCNVYYNRKQQGKFYCDSCEDGEKDRDGIVHTIPAGQFYSLDSVEDANRKAFDILKKDGQRIANESCNCMPVYYNEPIGGWYTKSCRPGYKSTEKYKLIPAGVSYSFIDVEDANKNAIDDYISEINEWADANCECIKLSDDDFVSDSDDSNDFEF